MSKKFYNLSNDYLFKSVFRNFLLLKKLAHDIFGLDLSGYSFENPRIQSENKNLSNGEYDLLLTNGKEYIVFEMQNSKYGNFINRSEIYKSSLISSSWKKDDKTYQNIKFAKLCWLLNYKYHKQDLLNYQMLEKTLHEKFGDENEIKIFGIQNFHKKELFKKYKILFCAKKKAEIEALINDKDVGEIARKILLYNEDLEIYQRMMRSETMNWSHEDDLRLMKQVAHTEGEKVGEKRGEKRGKLKTAKKLFTKGISLELIVEVTGLKKEQIENYINS